MLTEQGIIPRSGVRACLEALRDMDEAGEVEVRSELPDVPHDGEVFPMRKLGIDVGGLIHSGRISWDMSRVSNRVGLAGPFKYDFENHCTRRICCFRWTPSLEWTHERRGSQRGTSRSYTFSSRVRAVRYAVNPRPRP